MPVYQISTLIGDFLLEDQQYWDKEYETIEIAKYAARLQQIFFEDDNERVYTIIMEKDEDDKVEWLMHKNIEYVGEEATKMADILGEE